MRWTTSKSASSECGGNSHSPALQWLAEKGVCGEERLALGTTGTVVGCG
jgi:hypothetical protein